MLVRAFQIHVRGVTGEFRTHINHGRVGRPGVKPHVEGIRHFLVAVGVIAKDVAGIEIPPRLDAVNFNAFRHFFHQFEGTRVQFVGFFVHEQRHRHAPGTLTGDTPVRAVSDHRFDTRLAPVRDPLHAFDLFQRLRAQAFLIHAHEPLRGGAEDDRRFVAPAARIAVLHFFHVQQRAAVTQHLNDDVVGFEDVDAIQRRIGTRQVSTVRANRVGDFQTVFLADGVVVRTVAAGGMHRTGTRVQRHVVAKDRRHVEIEERMLKAHQLKLRTLYRRQNSVVRRANALHYALNQVFRQDQRLTVNLHQRVVEFRRQRDGAVSRQGPRRGGPDNQGNRAVDVGYAEFRQYRGFVYRVERHIDRRRGFVVILHFRFRQRGTAVNAPVHRLSAFMQMTVADDFTQRTDDVGFGFEVHGQVRTRPVAQHAQADKVFTLTVDLLRGIFAALGAEFSGGKFLTRLAVLLLDFQLDRQTVAVPARNVRRVIARQSFGLNDNVFQNLVNRVTNMNAAIRIRRAIMQNEGFFAFFGCTNDAVQVIIGPTRQHSRFAFGEVATHREPCFRQIQGRFIVTHQILGSVFRFDKHQRLRPGWSAQIIRGPLTHHVRFAPSARPATQTAARYVSFYAVLH